MIPPELRKPLLGIAAFTAALSIVAWSLEPTTPKKVEKLEQKAAEAKGKADEHAQTAAQADAKGSVDGRRVADAEAATARAKAELAALKRRMAEQPQPPTPVDPAPDLRAVVAKQDELIQAQGVQIEALKAQAVTLTTARDEWRAAFRAERDRADSLYLALEAQKAAAKGALWKGRIQGIAVGFAAGYVRARQ